MNENLPNEFDIIVIGTGLIESIIAAAASRIGKKVLHVDNNEYYGDLWASFNLDSLEKFVNTTLESHSDEHSSEENTLVIDRNILIKCLSVEWHIPENSISKKSEEKVVEPGKDAEEEEETSNEKHDEERSSESGNWTKEKLMQSYRKFNIDLTPKLLYSTGALVQLLISSNIARYTEFRNVSRILTWINNGLESVPCSRSDVFATKQVSVIEKRILMKLATEILDDERTYDEATINGTFNEFLEKNRVTASIKHFVLFTMASATESTSFNDGLQLMRKFLKSLGKYGNSPFLWTMYGSGEMPQCFCRLCAVFGGVYCLNRSVHNLILDGENKCTGVQIGDQTISATNIILGVNNCPRRYLPSNFQYVSHAAFITNKSIQDSEKEQLTYICFPPVNERKSPCIVIEVGSATSTCPQDLYVLYMFKVQELTDIKEDLDPYVSKIVSFVENDQLPQVLWSFYYAIPDFSDCDFKTNTNIPENVYLCSGPDRYVDYEFPVKQANAIFKDIYPDEEFLPRAPDPEEIVFDNEEETNGGKGDDGDVHNANNSENN